jgi:hypothetical protein
MSIENINKNENEQVNSYDISNINKLNNTVKDNIIKEGNKILIENIFFNDLDNIMTDPNFKKFYDTYFNDFTDIKVVIMYMKLYETIQIEYKKKNNCEIEKELLAYIMRELMNNHNSRKKIFDSYYNFMENNNYDKNFLLDFFDEKKIKKIKFDKLN